MIKGILFQESLYKEPFWMLVACILVNHTKWMQAEPVFEEIRNISKTDIGLALMDTQRLVDLLKPLGFYNRRAASLQKMASSYVNQRPSTSSDVLKLPGCGKYAADSWAIFVNGLRDVKPTDIELIQWLNKENNDDDS